MLMGLPLGILGVIGIRALLFNSTSKTIDGSCHWQKHCQKPGFYSVTGFLIPTVPLKIQNRYIIDF
jgi:hypothetical protein